MSQRSASSIDATRLITEIEQLTRHGASSPEDVATLVDAVGAFLLTLHPPPTYTPLIESICALATDHDATRADAGQRLLFAGIAEPLGDSFDPRAVHVYDELFADVIEICRHLPPAREVQACLAGLGVHSREDLLQRKARTASRRGRDPQANAAVRKVLVLSRVTIGADVAVTSVVLQKMTRLFPDAEVGIVGSGVPALFSLAGTIRAIPHRYERRGGLVARLASWVDLVATCARELDGLRREECLVVDPDSRLTQLGLLPVADRGIRCEFFESRGYERPGLDSISDLTADWLDGVFGADGGPPIYPRVSLLPAEVARAEAIVRRLRQRGAGHIVGINLGVGGNPRKQIGGGFELELVRGLVREGSTIILDYGTADEIERIGALVAALGREGHRVADIAETGSVDAADADMPTLVTYRGPIAPFTALLAESDLYVGYDSAFQHLAAAVGIPVIDIFVNPPNPLFPQRWRPPARRPVRSIEVSPPFPSADETLGSIRRAYHELRRPR